jgi:MoxR-like ATPase
MQPTAANAGLAASPATPAGPSTRVEAVAQILEIAKEATDLLTEEDLNNPPTPPAASVASEIDPLDLWKIAHVARQLFERYQVRMEVAESQAKKREAEAQDHYAQVHKREEELRQQKLDQQRIQHEMDERKSALERRERQNIQLEEKLKEREIDAEAGFLQQRRQALAKLDDEAKAMAKQIAEQHQSYLDGIKNYESELRQIRDRELAGVEAGNQQLQLEKQAVTRGKREAEWAKQEAEELKSNWVSRIEEKVRDAVTDRESRLQSALARCKELAGQISRYEETERVAAGKTREELMSELTALQERNGKLVSDLARKPADDQIARLRNLESENETLHSDLARLLQENQSLQSQMSKLSIGVAEMQNLRDQKAAWDSRERALRACVEDLRRELGDLVDKSKAQRVFPSLIEMDGDATLQTPPAIVREKLPPLKDLVEEIRNRIGERKLYYRDKDVRAFLAGLATSRLHLLQGISGTGKTSLPREFARAIGATSAIVEVQSGWRDRNDLLGYYNAFEKRYYESEFLQALYRAQQPQYRLLPFFIVLDEMNLSHPEHYFADFLSALEQTNDKQRVSLLTSRIDGAPQLLEEARWLRIPRNVWFIGTANHDETTKDFADKTYDRSHVMEFPRHPEAFIPKPLNSPLPIPLEAIEGAFSRAANTHKEASLRAKTFLNKSLTHHLEKLGLGWGNRLESQMDRFVPVIIDAGGTLGEATDHILQTKLLRKLRGRFDLGAKQLEEFQANLIQEWDKFDKAHQPEQCYELLEREIKRLNGA